MTEACESKFSYVHFLRTSPFTLIVPIKVGDAGRGTAGPGAS